MIASAETVCLCDVCGAPSKYGSGKAGCDPDGVLQIACAKCARKLAGEGKS